MIRYCLTIVATLLICQTATAKVTAVNVVVVVNADSDDSQKIADAYIAARGVPTENLIELHGVPQELKISLEDFQTKILMPVLRELDRRKLTPKTKVIAYSAGFPTSVNVSRHHNQIEDKDIKKYQRPTASLTGLTYLYYFLLADSPNYLGFGSNRYARGRFERHFANPFTNPSDKSAFDEAIAASKAEQSTKAAEVFEKLFQQNPTLSALAILAAENRAVGEDDEAATLLIKQAIAAGWRSAVYLRENPKLKDLVNRENLKPLIQRLGNHPIAVQEPIGFSSQAGWSNNGYPFNKFDRGIRYMMSCMLAVVHERGSTVDQGVEVLERAAKSDFTYPRGKFWFTNTKDIRTKARFPAIGDSIEWLGYLGQDADLVHSVMPKSEGNCIGLMLGTASMNLKNTPWKFMPGSISENLTSLSAAFGTSSQSKITDLLHAGAALSGGAVAEPYSIPNKFPSPMLYGYYASGVSGIEAFYLSIASPYQYLIVGDPLVQPFARQVQN
jgi:uncharacterized protein (TIGR03790 family)